MLEIKDQINRTVVLKNNLPQRIISLVPSQTELLYDLGMEAETIAITKFCVHPKDWFKHKAKIGGTKNIDLEKIRSLSPDLIIANKEENVREQIDAVAKFCPVYISDVSSLDDALKMIKDVGNLVGRKENALMIGSKIEASFLNLKTLLKDKKRVLYLIWKNPFMTVGGDTFINEMIDCCGFQNVYANEKRYPVVSFEQIFECDADIVFLSSEPYPFKEKHVAEMQEYLPKAKIILVDGEMFSWYGSRLLYAAEYFRQLIERL